MCVSFTLAFIEIMCSNVQSDYNFNTLSSAFLNIWWYDTFKLLSNGYQVFLSLHSTEDKDCNKRKGDH
jgi:hypothetical protein